jgi:UDP-glucose 4-epimerase
VLEAARAHDAQLVFSSTGGALYGECERPAREDDERRPLSPYGTSKLAGEAYFTTWNALHGMRNVILRFGNVYGPRQLAKLEGGVVAIFMDRIRAGEGVRIFGDGEQARDFVYVGDIVDAIVASFGREGGIFNVGTGEATTVNELFDAVRRVTGVDAEAEYADPRPGELLRSVLDVSKAERELGWRPRTTLEEGLRRTWDG